MVRIAIIGGGIGGLTAALAFQQFGFQAEVFEQAPELLEVGAAIAMWPNAMRVLERLGLKEKILEHGGVVEEEPGRFVGARDAFAGRGKSRGRRAPKA